jgi:hypothetical protein
MFGRYTEEARRAISRHIDYYEDRLGQAFMRE